MEGEVLASESCFCNDQSDAGDSSLASAALLDKSWMIECDVCHVWFHGGCVKLTSNTAKSIDKYHCPRCEPMCGPSLFRASTNAHRHDITDPLASSKATQIGTQVFVEELKRRHFALGSRVVQTVSSNQLTAEFLSETKFEYPLVVRRPDHLDLRVPNRLSPDIVCQLVGGSRIIDVIDVQRQETLEMSLAEFVGEFKETKMHRILNCLSLEVTDIDELDVEAPRVIRELCWVRNMWPNNEDYKQPDAPKVSKYCIMSMAKSYTDFHIDFGGTSVWYHIVTGSKIFYLIPPTSKNLGVFERWHRLSKQSETFFADMVGAGECHKMEVNEGETIFLPTGYIHAVYTPEDSLVLGGNFLHSFNIPLQLRIRDLEEKMRIPVKFKFPHYEKVNWYASQKLVQSGKSFLSSNAGSLPDYMSSGLKHLQKTLKNWDPENAPSDVNTHKLLREMSKVIKQSEKRRKTPTEPLKIKLGGVGGSTNETNETSPSFQSERQAEMRPIKLMIPKPYLNYQSSPDQPVNLTDRDSVRQLMLAKRKKTMKELNDELGNALMSFGDEEEEEKQQQKPDQEPGGDLQIDFTLPVKKRSLKSLAATLEKPNYFIPKMTEVYQDDDFVYPSLDFSDDDDIDANEEKKLNDKDGNWNPGARVKATAEKRARVPRDNARRIQVEKGLELASKRLKVKKKATQKLKKLKKVESSNTLLQQLQSSKTTTPTTSGGVRTIMPSVKDLSSISSTSVIKPQSQLQQQKKKGLATAKQRLGKKLKLKFC